MRNLLLLIASLFSLAGAAHITSAAPLAPPASTLSADGGNVVQVHSGPRACHFVRGRWWRDTRPYSKPGCYRGHRRWHHHHHHHRWHHRHHRWHRHHW